MKLTATFSDGTTITRKTDRAYTHAWICRHTWDGNQEYLSKGFSGSAALAHKELSYRTKPNPRRVVHFAEVAPVIQK